MKQRSVQQDRNYPRLGLDIWRCETILEDGAVEVAIFSGPSAETRARQFSKLLDIVDPI